MKKRVIHLFIAAGFLLLAGACSKEPTAKESMDQYVDKWNEQKFEEMYEQLSAEAQKSISKDDFIKRNQSIYEQIGVSEFWILDQPKKQLLVLDLGKDGKFVERQIEGPTLAARAVPGFRVQIDWLWSEPCEFPDTLAIVEELLRA